LIVRWTPLAEHDRREIRDYIARNNPAAAAQLDAKFAAAAEKLAILPHRGRPGGLSGTRELMPHKNYRLVYEVMGDTVWIIALIHTARRWPP